MLILKDDCLEKFQAGIPIFTLDLFTVEVKLSLEAYLLENELAECLFEPWRQGINLSYHLVVL